MDKQTTAMQDLKQSLKEAIDTVFETSINSVEYRTGYRDALYNVINDIEAQRLEKERQQMQDIFKNSRTIISDCEVWNCEGSVKKYESFEQYYTETFLTN